MGAESGRWGGGSATYWGHQILFEQIAVYRRTNISEINLLPIVFLPILYFSLSLSQLKQILS